MPIDQLPDPPDRTDGHATFVAKANAFLAALINFVTQANALETNVNNQEDAALSHADDSEASAVSSAASATSSAGSAADVAAMSENTLNFKGSWSNLTGALTVPSTVYHDGTHYQLLVDLADVTASEPGVTSDYAVLDFDVSRLKKYCRI